jgi:hypothetical protein
MMHYKVILSFLLLIASFGFAADLRGGDVERELVLDVGEDEGDLFEGGTKYLNANRQERRISSKSKGGVRGVRGYSSQDGLGIGLGTIWGSLTLGISRNPSLKDELFKNAIVGSLVVANGEKLVIDDAEDLVELKETVEEILEAAANM